MNDVAVLDLGTNNLGSLCRALRELGADPWVVDRAPRGQGPMPVVVPGVGAFARAMTALRDRGHDEMIKTAVAFGAPVLGICLGMQLLGTLGTEGGDVDGLDLIPGTVEQLVARPGERIPHVGWNEVLRDKDSVLLRNVPQGATFYFTHSYHLAARDDADVVAHTPHAGGFASVVERGRVFGVQFHPEKSQGNGRAVLQAFLGAA